MRELKRQIAKARMKALGGDRINRRMRKGAWRRLIDGDLAEAGLRAQLGQGLRSKRKIRRISA